MLGEIKRILREQVQDWNGGPTQWTKRVMFFILASREVKKNKHNLSDIPQHSASLP